MKQPGSLLLAWQVKDKHCLVIGGGDVALSRVLHLVRANAKITVVTGPKAHPEIEKLHADGELHKLLKRDYQPLDLTMYEDSHHKVDSYHDIDVADYENIQNLLQGQFACVCCCIDDPVLSTKVYYQSKHLRLPVNIADKPPMCDFYFGLMFNQDSLQIMISTNGKLPRLLKMIKDDIARQFADIRLNDAVDNLGSIRACLRKALPQDDLATIDARMQWIKKLTDFFSLRQWSQLELDEAGTSKIVGTYPGYPPADYDQFKGFLKA